MKRNYTELLTEKLDVLRNQDISQGERDSAEDRFVDLLVIYRKRMSKNEMSEWEDKYHKTVVSGK